MLVKTFEVEATGSAFVLIAFDVLLTRNDCTLVYVDSYPFSLMVIFGDLVGQGSEIFIHVDHKQLQLLSRRDG